jgi:hypothetical protein
VLAVSQPACLILAVLTFLGTVVVLAGFVVRSAWSDGDASRRPARDEHRAVVLESCGLAAGVAVAFLAVSLILGAARADPGDQATAAARLVPMVPGLVALIGAVVIIAATAPQSRPAQPGSYQTPAGTGPQAFPIAY